MTPRRPLHAALTLIGGGLVAAALVGCGNGMQVAGPDVPHESVVTARATPSGQPSAAESAEPSAEQSSPAATDRPSDGAGSGEGGGSDDSSTSGKHPGKAGGGRAGKGTGRKDSGKGSGGTGSGGHDSGGQHTSGTGAGTEAGTGSDRTGSDDTGSDDTGSRGTDGAAPGDGPSSAPSTNSTGGTGGTDSTETPATGRTCQLDDLAVGARIPAGGAAAGSSYVLITFTNRSDSACWMYGYAGVSFVGNQDGTQLGRPAVRDHSTEPQRVKLRTGETQTELLRIAAAGNFDPEECVPTTSDGFRIYPPSSYTAAYVEFKTDACQGKGVRQLSVYPVGTKG